MASISDVFIRMILDDSGIPHQAQVSGQKAGQTFGQRFQGGLKTAFQGAIAGIGIGAGISAFNTLGTAVEHVTDFMKESVGAAAKLQSANVLLNAAIKQNVQGWDGNTEAIDKATRAGERLGFTNLEQRDSLRVLVAQTKDLDIALQVQRVAMDLARLRGIDLGTATLLLGKAYNGNITALKRFGIALETGTKGVAVLQAVEKLAGGQAEAFSHTQEGAAQALAAEWEGFKEQLGGVVLPALTAVTHFATESVIPALRQVGDAVGVLAHVLGPVLGPVLDHLPAALGLIAAAFAGKLLIGLLESTAAFLGLGKAATQAAAAIEAEGAAASATSSANVGNAASIDLTSVASDTLSTASDAATLAGKGLLTQTKQTSDGMKEGATQAKGYSLSLRTIGFAGLILIPILGSIQDSLANLSNRFAYGGKFGKDYATVLDAVAGSQGQAAIAFDALSQSAKEQNQPLSETVRRFTDLVDAGVSVNDALVQVRSGSDLAARGLADADRAMLNTSASADTLASSVPTITEAFDSLDDTLKTKLTDALDKSGAILTGTGAFWVARLHSGEAVYAAGAEELADKLPKAQQAALDKAKLLARKTPGEIAASLLQGEKDVESGAAQLADAVTRKLQLKIDIAETRRQIRSLGRVTTDEQKVTLGKLQAQLAGYLLEADPKSKEAAALLQKYLKSSDPATRLAAQQLLANSRTEYQNALPEVLAISKQYGLALPEALAKYKADAAQKAGEQAEAARVRMAGARVPFESAGASAGAGFSGGIGSPANKTGARNAGAALASEAQRTMGFNGYAIGFRVGGTWVQGIINSINGSVTGTGGIRISVQKVANILKFTGSPAYSESRIIGEKVGTSWTEGIASAVRKAIVPNPLAAAMPSFGMSPAMAVAGGTIGPTSTVINHFHFAGVGPRTDTAREVTEGISRLMPHALIGR